MEDVDCKTKLTLLQPEVLSRIQLLENLKQRCLSGIDSLSKEALIDLYYKHIIPLPQRKYRLNRRGKDMTKNQIVISKRKRTYSQSVGEEPILYFQPGQSKISHGDRLKPPPVLTHKKPVIVTPTRMNSNSTNPRIKPPPTTGIIRLNSLEENTSNQSTEKSNIIKLTPYKPVIRSPVDKPNVVKLNISQPSTDVTMSEVKSPTTPSSVKPVKLHRPLAVTKQKLDTVSGSETNSNIIHLNSVKTNSVGRLSDQTSSKTKQTSEDKNTTIKIINKHLGSNVVNRIKEESSRKTSHKKESKVPTTEEEIDGVVQKKFKRIDIQWP